MSVAACERRKLQTSQATQCKFGRKLQQTIRHGAIEKSEAQSNSLKKLMVLPAQSFARTSPSLSPPSEFCIRSGLFHPTAAQFAVWQPLVFLPIKAISNKCQATSWF